MKIVKFSALLLGVAFLTTALSTLSAAASESPPQRMNLVLFLIDDLGWSDLGCYGSSYYETPHIDRLAERGMKFTDAYASCCVCSPTRAALLTGRYPARLMLTEWLPSGRWDAKKYKLREGRYLSALPLQEFTLAEALREAGYKTGHFGKWHLGGLSYYYPEHQGFDVNVGGNDHGAPGDYFYPYQGDWKIPTTETRSRWRVLEEGREGDYLTDVLTDKAVEFIKENQDQSFFVYLSHYAVHTPIQGKEEIVNKYRNKPPSNNQSNPGYAAMIESVDQSVGRVMETLEELGLRDRTLVIFTSDNGGNGKVTSNSPLRGNKGNYYEGGIRVPALVLWPGQTQPGSVSSEPIISSDFYPTVLECLGLPLRPTQHVDGLSLVPVLKQSSGLAREALYWHYPHYITNHPNPATPMGVIRAGDWKLLEFFEDGHLELYNLKDDLGERRDLAGEMPDRVREMREKLARWREEVRAEMPWPNPFYERDR